MGQTSWLGTVYSHLGDDVLSLKLCLIGLVVKASSRGVEDSEFSSRHGDFFGSSHTSDLKIGTPVAILQGACCYQVSTGTGWTGVNVL